MSLSSRIRTSKWLLALVILSGPAAVLAGWEPTVNQLIVYLASVGGVVFNRLDSRKQGYEATFSFGQGSIRIKTGGYDESDEPTAAGGAGGPDPLDDSPGRVTDDLKVPQP